MTKRFSVLLLALLLGALPVTPYALEPGNLDGAKQELNRYIASGEYGQRIAEVALSANKFLTTRVARAKPAEKLAIVFDIDETTLTNLSLMQAYGYGYHPPTWDDWVNRGKAPAIIPVQTVYDNAMRHNVAVFFITGRTESNRTGTERNLREVGYEGWTKIYFKPADVPQTTQQFKTATRKAITAQGYTIVASLGDQDSDLAGGFAEKTFKLPNPFYLVK